MGYSIVAAAEALGVSRPTIYSWIEDGTIERGPDGLIDKYELGKVASARVTEAAAELLRRQDIAAGLRADSASLSPYDYRKIIEEYINSKSGQTK